MHSLFGDKFFRYPDFYLRGSYVNYNNMMMISKLRSQIFVKCMWWKHCDGLDSLSMYVMKVFDIILNFRGVNCV